VSSRLVSVQVLCSDERARELTAVLEAEGDIRVVARSTPQDAVSTAQRVNPDVAVVDLGVPDAIWALEQMMGFAPLPIVALGPAEGRSSTVAAAALVAGALEAMPCPDRWDSASGRALRRRIRVVRGVTVVRHQRARVPTTVSTPRTGSPVVAIAASTGGPAAVAEVLSGLSGLGAPVLVVQHIHADFVDSFASVLSRSSALPVTVAMDGDRVRPGVVYVGPGGVHLGLSSDRRIVLSTEPEGLHRPSADQLFLSMAASVGAASVGVILTGMGDDGAVGLQEIRRAGGMTIAQDEATSAVYGMPAAAAKVGAVRQVLPLNRIADAVVRSVRARPSRNAAG
jgi:two-component system, chemotaxis family, protein-glutamate methylesterase/glutaminase